MKKNYYCYRATVVFSGSVGATSEEEAIDKVVKESEKYPEQVSFKPGDIKVRKLQKKPNLGLYHDSKYDW
tara:strand:+ start:2983 stop:3192 length:210 start_codon:yes stop_codon:yes gene_type:complete